MTEKTALSSYVAIGVAPASVGFMQLGEALKTACSQAGLTATSPVRLLASENKWAAVEFNVALGKSDLSDARLHLLASVSQRFDSALLPASSRRKHLLISDMDSTIIEQECLDELAAYAGLKDQIAAITARAMAGELDFEAALTERVAKLKGLSLQALEQCYADRITLMPGAKTLVATMRTHGAHCLLVSGGFTYFTQRIADAVGFHDHRGNTLIDNGKTLTGEVKLPILGRQAKLDALNQAVKAHDLQLENTIAMGDGANDLAMIEAAGLGLAVHAKPVVSTASDAAINHTDLTTALYFQGYTDSEIVWRD